MMTLESAAPHRNSPATAARPVRVCYVIDELRRAGTELRLQRLIEGLPRDLIQPHLCLLRGLGDALEPAGPADCPILELDLRSLRSWKAVSAARRMRRFLRQHEVEIVELYFRDALVFGAPVARAAGVRHIVQTAFNLGYWMTRTDRLVNYLARPLIQYTITNCEAGRTAAIENFRIRAERTAVLSNGIELQPFLKLPPPEQLSANPRIGMVANLRPVKGIFDFLQAARLLVDCRPELRFSVAGEGELRAEIEGEMARLMLAEHFQLVGRIEDIPGYLSTLDIAVLASHSEGLSNSLIEYLAAARPVVATDVGGAREVLGDGRFGLLTAPRSPDRLAESLGAALDHYGDCVARAAAGRTHVAAQYGIPRMTMQFTQFYQSLAGIPANGSALGVPA
jgi:L-malate glycosyltransferase